MANNGALEQKKVNIEGTEYTLQMVPASWYMDHTDKCKNDDGVLMTSKYAAGLFQHVVVQPRVNLDSFTGKIRRMRKLITAVEEFLMGDEEDELGNAESPTTSGE